MRARKTRDRKGLNLIETLLVSAIAIVLLGVVYYMLTRSMELADSSSKSIQIQQGARNLVENMVRDVNTCHMFAFVAADNFTILKYQTDKPDVVAGMNVEKGLLTYPFFTDGKVTEHVLPVFRCSYKWDKNTERVLRKVTRGTLVSKTPLTGALGDNLLRMAEFSLADERSEPGEPAEGRVMATKVKAFNLSYFAYDDDADGGLKEFSTITARTIALKRARVAMVVLNFKALFDEGLYKDRLKQPEIEVMTKIWSYKRINDHVYKEYFSSQDEDTRF